MVERVNSRTTSVAAWSAAAASLMLAGAGIVLAADPALSPGDREFLSKAAQGGVMEVTAGKLAVSRAENPAVRSFGQHMVDDHTAANEQLKSVADAIQTTLPDSSGTKEQRNLAKLEALNGARFDRAYATMMVEDHEQDVRVFAKEARHGKDPQVKAFAQQTLPTLRRHLQMAKQLASRTKESASDSG